MFVFFPSVGIAGKGEFHSSNISELITRYPLILWWNPLTGKQTKVKSCDGKTKCVFMANREYQHHPQTKVFLFYGTDFNKDDLPLPRAASHQWALFHEESPKNNYILTQEEVITLFNHTATFQRTSDYPLTTQYLRKLEDLTSDEFLVPLSRKKQMGLAPLVYIHSDCNPPSDRDTFVAELMKYIPVDSYGRCLHNKDLPHRIRKQDFMDDKELYKILAKYRFTISIENAICDDYITEKLWRPLSLGTVPVYRGSPSIRDWLPANNSVILIDDFKSAKELAEYLQYLLQNEGEYKKYFEFRESGIKNERLKKAMQRREWGVNDFEKINFITGFECFVCNRVYENLKRKQLGQKELSYLARSDHLSCPRPQSFSLSGNHNKIQLYELLFNQSVKDAVEVKKKVNDRI